MKLNSYRKNKIYEISSPITITVYQATNQYINRFCQRLAASMKNYKIHAKKYLKYQKQKATQLSSPKRYEVNIGFKSNTDNKNKNDRNYYSIISADVCNY